eukprot:TRINITY_DN41182_c0_g1_i1.p1 TRINITY_DN41182_c0_g1~~TRINITY_DN41182_c0_g1_i1.p1  ORF type:complete len:519 (+),score=45.22 TRINITY_DN41182_c0_g1_i1:71-1627(+)
MRILRSSIIPLVLIRLLHGFRLNQPAKHANERLAPISEKTRAKKKVVHPKQLCEKHIVSDVCASIDLINDPSVVVAAELAEAMFISSSSVRKALQQIQSETVDDRSAMDCQKLCAHVVDVIHVQFHAVLPPAPDIACRRRGEDKRLRCDVDLTPKTLQSLEFPDRTDRNIGHVPQVQASSAHERTSSAQKDSLSIQGRAAPIRRKDDIVIRPDVDVLEFLQKLANLFRVYPFVDFADADPHDECVEAIVRHSMVADKDKQSSFSQLALGICDVRACTLLGYPGACMYGSCKACPRCSTIVVKKNVSCRPAAKAKKGKDNSTWPQWRRDVETISITAQTYVEKALQLMARPTAGKNAVFVKWFGTNRHHIETARFTLNSVSRMLSNVAYTRADADEDYCLDDYGEASLVAFVFPHDPKLAKNDKGQFKFFLCDLFFQMDRGVQIETLIHEGSHHATAFTSDACAVGDSTPDCVKAYGRDLCQELAVMNPSRALKNADSYCFYAYDLVTSSFDKEATQAA